ncbi:MAG: leucine-rich repeat domain-containing protein [Clostridiales bacterium]|nr:leucine-rich repeat domain-containing protein [Clostridiales bacterium]
MKIRKLVNLLFTIMLILLLGSMFLACDKDDIHNLKVKYENVQLPINGSLYISNYITYDGKGKLTYSIENTDVLELDGQKVTGLSVGVGKVIVSTPTETVGFDVYVVDPYQIDIEAIDTNEVYDGQVKNILVKGDLPQSSLRYFVDGQEFFGTKEPGVYQVEVLADLPKEYNANYIKQTATLTIEKATYSLDVRFLSASYEYDGTPKELLITGNLPPGVTVKYKNNKHTDAGVYDATAEFIVDTRYYYEILPLNARLTIAKAKINYSTFGFEDKIVTYNGQSHYVAFESLPQGFVAQYYLESEKEENKISDITSGFVDAGNYKIVAVISAPQSYTKNYVFESKATATLNIQKADFINNLRWNDDAPTAYIYDGVGVTVGQEGSIKLEGEKPIGVNGEFPAGVDFTYHYKISGIIDPYPIGESNNTKVDVGIYTVVAKFDMPEGYQKNYNKLDDMEFTFAIQKAPYNIDNVLFEGKTFTFDNKGQMFEVDAPANFYDDVKIEYDVKKNGEVILSKSLQPYLVKDAGDYAITAYFTYKTDNLNKNYLTIPSKTISVKVNKLAVELGNILFPNAEYTYDNESVRSLEILGTLPDNVEVGYSQNNGQTNAGRYEIIANFYYFIDGHKINEDNFYFTQNSVQVGYSKTANLTIKKASYTPEQVGEYKVFGGTYSPNITLSDYTIYTLDNEPAQNIVWQEPSLVPTAVNAGYIAIFNKDNTNYNDYEIILPIEIEKAVIDGQSIEIKTQFLPRTGAEVKPLFTLDGYEDTHMLKVVINSDRPLIELGEYDVDVSFELIDSNNYEFNNAPEPVEITIYVYNGTMFDYNGTQLTKYKGGAIATLTIPHGTTGIKNGAIKNISNITEIILPSTLRQEEMSNGAINLNGATNLTDIKIPFVGVNGKDYFASLFELSNKDLPKNLERVTVTNQATIYKDTFKDCKSLKSIIYLNDVQSVGENAFNGCVELRNLVIGSQMTSIGQNAFRQCLNLTELTLPFIGSNINDQTSTISYLIGANAGENAYTNYMLSTLTINGDIVALPSFAFAGLEKIGKIVLPNTITSIGQNAFENVKATINLNDNITIISERMFANYKGTMLLLPSSVTEIGVNAFYEASNLTSLTLPKSVTSIGEYAFSGVKCNVVFEQGAAIKEIGINAFYGYLGNQFSIPESVYKISDYAFSKSGITSITIPQSVSVLGEGVFQGSENLIQVTLLNTVVSSYMFSACKNLNTINFENVERIENNAFEGCESLQSVMLKEKVSFVGNFAFYGTGLESCEIRANIVIDLFSNSFIEGLTIRVHNSDQYQQRYAHTSYQFFTWDS